MNSESAFNATGDESPDSRTELDNESRHTPEDVPQTKLPKSVEKTADLSTENDTNMPSNEADISKATGLEENASKAVTDSDDEGEYEWEVDFNDELSDGSVSDEEEQRQHILMQHCKYHQARLHGRSNDPELPSSVTRLRIQDGERNAVIYLIGTAHFSEVSNKEVADLVEKVLPDRIVLELDASRCNILFMDEERLITESKSYDFAAFKDQVAKQGVSFAVMHYLLLRMSSSLVEQLGMAPGGEFRSAVQAGARVPGCSLFYGDRPLRLTLRRAFGQLSFFSRLRLATALLSSLGPVSREDVERLKQSDLVEAMVKELEAQFPVLTRVFVDERDRYLARAIFDFAAMQLEHRHLLPPEKAEQPVVLVAVVGMGHVAGIVRYWDQAEDIDPTSLCEIPKESRSGVIIRRSLKWAAIGGIIYGGYCLLAHLAGRFF